MGKAHAGLAAHRASEADAAGREWGSGAKEENLGEVLVASDIICNFAPRNRTTEGATVLALRTLHQSPSW